MTVRELGATIINPKLGSRVDVVFNAAPATAMSGTNVVQISYQDTAFTTTEGKQRLLYAIEAITDFMEQASFTWPGS